MKQLIKSTVFKFNSLQSAQSFSYRSQGGSMIILGCDGLYWVTTMADGERLIRAGYQGTK